MKISIKSINMTEPTNATVNPPPREFNPWLVYVWCLGIALVFMFFFGLNSPLHTFNSLCDFQWFMTMGHGLLAGKVPYRDLFEQKGPLTYVVFAVACCFPNEQLAIWCVEVLCISLYLFFGYRIARKFLSPWLSLAVVPLMMAVLCPNYARGLDGACVEEYCLPIFAYGLLCFLDALMDQRPVTWRRSLAIGICLGLLLWVKYSMLEFCLVPLLIWLIINLVHRNFTQILRSGLIMGGGILLVTIPVLIGFAAVGALNDLWTVYFQLNLNSYSGSTETATVNPWHNFLQSFFLGDWFMIFFIWGVICFAVCHWRQKSGWLLLITVVITWVMIGFFCGYLYYYLPLFTYTILGAIYAVKVLTKVLYAVGVVVQRRRVKSLWLALVTVLSFLVMLPFVHNLAEINRPRSAYAPLVVADLIAEYNQTAAQSATLFCYQMSDCGFYNAAGIVPNVRFYAQNSFTREAFPVMFDDFDATIRNQLCDFVVTYLQTYQENETLLSTYYHPYLGTLAESTLTFNFYDSVQYGKNQIVILLKKEQSA
ncbi:MAG: glycosyltransferase family 39 protein [Prevotella sp.]|nr:glycosyltransferase family 39 protein [Prevotella sp.]